MSCLLKRITLFLFIFSFFFSLNTVCAENIPVNKIVKELSTLKATVIKGPGGKYLINMGADNNLKKGNLWTLYTTGAPVIDPATGKKLGMMPLPIGICKVTRVEKHFSEISIKCFEESCNIKSGIVAKRYHAIKAVFQDVNSSSFYLYETIRAKLPLLDWQGYQRIESPSNGTQIAEDSLVIVANKGRVTIWSGGEILLLYDEMTSARKLTQPSIHLSTSPVTEGEKSDLKQKAVAGPPGIMVPGLRKNLKVETYRAVTSINHIVTNLGIIKPDGTNTPYFVYLSNKTLYARAVASKEKHQYFVKGFGDVVNMSMGPNGLIACNVYVKNSGMESRILKFTADGFTVLAKDIDYILEFVDIDGDGINEFLIGQDFDEEIFFGSGVFHLAVDDSGRITQQDSILTPGGFNLFGSIMADLDGNKIKETAFYNPGGKLVVYENNNQKWESQSPFDPIKIMLIEDMTNESNAPKNLPVWPQPVLFNSGDSLVVAVPANQTGIWGIVGGRSKNGGLGILYLNSGTYTFRLLNTKFQGPVQSISAYNNELYIAVVEGNVFTGKGKTHILAVPINVLKESMN